MINNLWIFGNLFVLTGMIGILHHFYAAGTVQFVIGLTLLLIWKNFRLK